LKKNCRCSFQEDGTIKTSSVGVATIKNNEDSFNRLKKTSQVVVVVVSDVFVFVFVDVIVDNVDIDFVVVTIKKL
jgi:hypothetical protein